MSQSKLDALIDEISDLLPALNEAEVKRLNEYMNQNDYESVRFYLSFLAKQHQIDRDEVAERQDWFSEEVKNNEN